MPVEALPVVVASGLVGDPGLEIGMGGVWVIVLVILAVIPVVPLMRLAIRKRVGPWRSELPREC